MQGLISYGVVFGLFLLILMFCRRVHLDRLNKIEDDAIRECQEAVEEFEKEINNGC